MKKCLYLAILGLAFVFAACNIFINSSTPTDPGLTVTPSSATVARGDTQQFTATVSGTNNIQTVTWSIVETSRHSGTTISASGLLTVSADETLATLTIKAISTVDTTKSGTATVTVPAPAATPTVTGVTVTPSSATVARGGTQQFTATVSGTNNPAQTVTWSLSADTGNTDGTSISSSGLLTVSANQNPTTLTIRATSTVDTTKSGTASVTVPPPGSSN